MLSADSIVSPKRKKEIISGCSRDQTHFICHKATQEGKDIVCNTFYEKLGHVSQMIRIAGRLNMIQFVDQPESEKLPTFKDMEGLRNV